MEMAQKLELRAKQSLQNPNEITPELITRCGCAGAALRMRRKFAKDARGRISQKRILPTSG